MSFYFDYRGNNKARLKIDQVNIFHNMLRMNLELLRQKMRMLMLRGENEHTGKMIFNFIAKLKREREIARHFRIISEFK
jgi:hypothetical protein